MLRIIQLTVSAFCLTLSFSGLSAEPQIRVSEAATVSITSFGAQGDDLRIYVDVDLENGWKTYYKSADDYDTQLKFRYTEPYQVVSHKIEWPPHEVIEFYGSQVAVYTDDVTLPVQMELSGGYDELDTLDFSLEIYFCSNVCIKELLPFRIPIR